MVEVKENNAREKLAKTLQRLGMCTIFYTWLNDDSDNYQFMLGEA